MLIRIKIVLLVLLLVIFSHEAFAQNAAPDPALVQKGIGILQNQRNHAMDDAASAWAMVAKLQDENAALKKENDDLKAKAKENAAAP